MAGENERNNGKDPGSSNKRSNAAGSERSNGASTANTGTGTGTTAGTAAGTGTAAAAKEEKLPAVASVKKEEKAPELPAGLTPIVPVPPAAKQRKPKKVTKAKQNKKEETVDATQLNTLIKTVSGLVASRPGNAHWMLSDKEIDSITTPLVAMLKEMEVIEKVAEHSNALALSVACISVFAPRVMITVNQKKEVKKVERELKRTLEPPKDSNKKPGGGNDKGTSGTGAGNGADVPFYGSALY